MPAVTRKSPYAFLPTLDRQGRGGTVQRVQDVVRDAIVRLELPPGTAIDKAALCARLGVSRFPVSEALGRLAAEGFFEVLPQRGTRVARIDEACGCPAGASEPGKRETPSRAHRAALSIAIPGGKSSRTMASRTTSCTSWTVPPR